jgi:hypothetical protein
MSDKKADAPRFRCRCREARYGSRARRRTFQPSSRDMCSAESVSGARAIRLNVAIVGFGGQGSVTCASDRRHGEDSWRSATSTWNSPRRRRDGEDSAPEWDGTVNPRRRS